MTQASQCVDLTTWSPSKLKALTQASTIIQTLQHQLPTNPDSTPLAYIDPAVIQGKYSTIDPQETPLEDVDDAIVPLQYGDGYPATHFGTPFWECLENEPADYFDLFRQYRESSYIKYLQKRKPGDPMQPIKTNGLTGRRMLTTIASQTDTDRRVLRTISLMYHWPLRAQCYDLFMEQQLQVRRNAEIQYMQSEHQRVARHVFEKCETWLNENSELLNPKTALEWMQMSIELERLSLGLPKDKPSGSLEEERQDRRPWVNIFAQQVNNPDPNANGNGTGGSSSGTQEETTIRLSEVLRILQDANALNEGSVIDVESESEYSDHDAPDNQ